ncbi:MAG: FABP family protein [Cyclobacteriaceae bacterium]|nr:FABP family protein [Cyclobacteriaceae bacterium]
MKKLLLLLIMFPAFAHAQAIQQDTVWNPIKFFVGEWTGKGEGAPGKGEYERTYQFILGNKFIEIKNKTTYPPTDKKPKGEIHEDIGYISYDRNKKRFVLRQFHVEGFVNTYVSDSISPDNKIIVFITEQIENIPAGWKARETYRIINNNEFVETFELAEPGKDFFIYTQATFKRK